MFSIFDEEIGVGVFDRAGLGEAEGLPQKFRSVLAAG